MKIGGFFSFPANALDRAARILDCFLTLITKHVRHINEDATEFRIELQGIVDARKERMDKMTSLMSEFEHAATDPETRLQVLKQIAAINPENRRLKAILAFYGAIVSDWPGALESANTYLQLEGREDALRLGTNILVPGILRQMGENNTARSQLQQFCHKTSTTWYRQICETLLGERTEEDLMEKGGKVPENILTAHTALGFWAEARGDRTIAIRHYREALGSYLDNWVEYNLARQRYMKLREKE